MSHRYVIGLGSNRRHGRHGSPAGVLDGAVVALGEQMSVVARAPTFRTAPLGPGGRAYANSAVVVETPLDPPALLACLKAVERRFGRRQGRRWAARVLDLDILLWSGGTWRSPRPGDLHVPHRDLARRGFVLDPLAALVPDWRVPGQDRVRRLHARLRRRPAAVDPSARAP